MYRYGPKRKWVLGVLLAAAQAGIVLPAGAAALQDEAPARHAHAQWPQASLSAEASAQVAQDTVTITLAAELDGASQAKVAEQLSATLGHAMKQVADDPKVKASTGNVRVWPVDDNRGRISGWHGRAEIVLESTDFKAAAQAARAGDGMAIAGLRFSVSRAARAKAEQALLAEASQAFRARAQALASAFGFVSYRIRNIELGGSGAVPYQPAPRMMAMAASVGKAAPVPLEGTTETVTVSVRGSIFLRSTQK